VIKKMEAQVGQFLLRCKCPVSGGIVVPKLSIEHNLSLYASTSTFTQRYVLKLSLSERLPVGFPLNILYAFLVLCFLYINHGPIIAIFKHCVNLLLP